MKNLADKNENGNPLVQVTQHVTKPLVSELDLIEAGVDKTRAKRTIQAAGGAPIGNRWFVSAERFSAYLDAQGRAVLASRAPKPGPKKPTTATMTAVDAARAAGLTVVGGRK